MEALIVSGMLEPSRLHNPELRITCSFVLLLKKHCIRSPRVSHLILKRNLTSVSSLFIRSFNVSFRSIILDCNVVSSGLSKIVIAKSWIKLWVTASLFRRETWLCSQNFILSLVNLSFLLKTKVANPVNCDIQPSSIMPSNLGRTTQKLSYLKGLLCLVDGWRPNLRPTWLLDPPRYRLHTILGHISHHWLFTRTWSIWLTTHSFSILPFDYVNSLPFDSNSYYPIQSTIHLKSLNPPLHVHLGTIFLRVEKPH